MILGIGSKAPASDGSFGRCFNGSDGYFQMTLIPLGMTFGTSHFYLLACILSTGLYLLGVKGPGNQQKHEYIAGSGWSNNLGPINVKADAQKHNPFCKTASQNSTIIKPSY